LRSIRLGQRSDVVTLEVQPRPTPEERADTVVPVDVEPQLADLADTIEEWATHRPTWEFMLQEGHDFGRANNVEGRLLYVAGEQTSSLLFRLDQLDGADDAVDTLVLRFEERDGICVLARCTSNGLDVELHHILTFT
jgi:hypothetical protein